MSGPFISHAQNFEDVRLWRAFSDIGQGRYLDIGTQDPVRDSVSLAFYERGWRGVHVEPTPAYAAAMRAARPDETVIEAAVSTASGPIRFFEIPETGLSTGITSLAERHAGSGWSVHEIAVPTVTLAGLFDLMGDPIHWMKIDVEGMEADVLASWGDHPARPAALVIEATAPTTQVPTHEAWYDLVLSRGYRDVLFDGLSRYFIHESHEQRGPALALSPNVFDGFQVTGTHFATGWLGQEHEAAIEQLHDEAEAAIAATQAELAAQIETQSRALAEAWSEIAVRLEQNSALAREAGQLQGQLAAQAEATAARLRDAEILRHDLATQLDSAVRRLALGEAELRHEQERRKVLAGELASAEGLVATLREQCAAASAALTASEGREADQARQNAALELQLGQAEARAGDLDARLMQLQAHSARQAAQLAQAAQLLVHAPDPIAGWPRRWATTLARLAGRAPEAVAAAHSARVAAWQEGAMPHDKDLSDDANFTIAETTGFVDLAAPQRNPVMPVDESPITSVPRLLAPHDAEFIRVAYQAVLGRAPDPEGGTYYLARLRAGTHKLEILRQLRRSPEGRAFVPGVAGLDRAIRRHRTANLPLVGWIIRWWTGADGNGAIERQLRVIVNEVGRLRDEQVYPAAATYNHPNELTTAETPPDNPHSAPTSATAPAFAPPVDFGHIETGDFDHLDSHERRTLAYLQKQALLREVAA